ncbi:MAG: extracellular solute-binding protein, partial [Clostridiaceae bacterium]|nr:extracellular solute-binding protein [Clostridiaceae bacterium]
MRKTKLVSLLSMMLSIVLIVTLFAGCVKQDKTSDSNKSQDTTESVSSTDKASEDDEISFPLKEKVTYTGFAPMRGEYSIDETFAFQIAAENNINFEITSALESSYKETRDILLAGGEYPDFFINSDVDGELYGAQEGILIPLDDLIRTYAPNLTKMMDERDAWDFLTCTDGHIYTLPAFWDQTPRDGVLWLNEKWLNNLGLKEPTSLEELYQVLKAFKEKDANGNGDPNDEIPFLSMKYNDALPQTLYILLNYFDYRYMAEFKLIVEGDKVRFFPLTDECREALGYFTKLYQEGLVNQDCFTLERDVAKAKARAGDVVGSFIGGSLT